MFQPELLYILPTYDHFDYARRCLESFVRNTPQGTYGVAIIDDGSPDWFAQRLQEWPACPTAYLRFEDNAGLTRSWNSGLQMATQINFKYAVCGNSDLLFTENWWPPLRNALDNGFDLVGPVTNAPGHADWQNVQHYCTFRLCDDIAYLDKAARIVRDYRSGAAINCAFINGFCMAAKTSSWLAGAFNSTEVFDPKYKLTGNEDELQARWRQQGKKIGFVPQSFVFHYRSVSRPDALNQRASRGAYRNEGVSDDARVHADEHRGLVDARVEECREVPGCQASDHPQL